MPSIEPRAESFTHGADIGVRGVGPTREAAFEQTAVALAAAIADLRTVKPDIAVDVSCEAPSDHLLLVDWLNALIYEMATRQMLFRRFAVTIEDHRLSGEAWGEAVDRVPHEPAVEPKGATYTALEVERRSDGTWVAQCVIDV